jgi:large subunit ribosomal protein L9
MRDAHAGDPGDISWVVVLIPIESLRGFVIGSTELHATEEMTMQVLLLKDVDQLGQAGEVKKVAAGYARNYLIPRGLAAIAAPGVIRQARIQRSASARREARALSKAQEMAQFLDGKSITFQARAGESDRLYGSITNANVAEALQEQLGAEVDRRKIQLEEPLKELGVHAITIRLATEAEAKVTVIIEREE